ncbi:hypothetical protein CABS01_15840 [Colletotrichum abscissum]|uniref:Uncharacterized protein n=1 Tax=Colletotrichum abscissum TaxID=1671311 RepID=A0A9Q0AZU8_9PEZI|nr:uncharacterized protein CABS01_15840 [Colletotrichum abscissum]KAI3535677.1 hypothetical protein CABS02_12866 [Colletotrichum abscissum]KAK1474378.1 hypothetical protein CABS01_15840 [Colletotrichum abscissum]
MKSNQTFDQKKKQKEEKTLQMADPKNEDSKSAGPAGKVARSSTAQQQQQQHEKPRRVIKPRPQHASSLETADDDEYDDCWDPYYEDSPAKDDKVVEEGFVLMKKPNPSR